MQPLSFLASPGGQSLRLPMLEVDELSPEPLALPPVLPLAMPEPVAPPVVPAGVLPLVPGR